MKRGRELDVDYFMDRNADIEVCPARLEPSVGELAARMRVIEDSEQHFTLRSDLIDHLWSLFGQ